MARIQIHHLEYLPEEWTMELNMLMHRTISRIQQTKATPAQYALLTNYMHSVGVEWNRMRKELDVGGDFRNLKPKKEGRKNGKAKGKRVSLKDRRKNRRIRRESRRTGDGRPRRLRIGS